MIKQILATTLFALAPMNTNANQTYKANTDTVSSKTLNRVNGEQYYYNQNFAYNSYLGTNDNNLTGAGQYRGKILTSIAITPSGDNTTINVRTLAFNYINNYQGSTNFVEEGLLINNDIIYNWNISNFDYVEWGYDYQNTNSTSYIDDMYNAVFLNRTSYDGIYNQISTIHTLETQSYSWENGGGLKQFTKGVDDQEMQYWMNAFYGENQKNYTNTERTWTVEEPNLFEGFEILYIEITATRENMDATTITSYANTFLNLRSTVNISLQYAEIVINPGITYEYIDIPGLMFTILGMPFAWISTAFNLTLFPGTEYAINISHLFMAIIAVLALIFIIKKVIK